jgi:predicted transposase YbfD/YdcC
LLKDNGLAGCGLTLDALHCQVETLNMVLDEGGVYVVEVKANQATLCDDLADHVALCSPLLSWETHDKAHGRLEKRTYSTYDIAGICFEDRWQRCQMKRLVVVNRHFTHLKSGKVSEEQSFYVSNAGFYSDHELGCAIRRHWSIESSHWLRDVTFGEDAIRCSNETRIKNLALFLSVGLNLIKQHGPPNIKAFHEDANANPLIISSLFKHCQNKQFL